MAQRCATRLGWPLTVATATAVTFIIFSAWLLWTNLTSITGIDFISFWAAGRISLEGSPAGAYDIAAHRAIELQVLPLQGLMPFPYPPPFLLIVTPLSVLPYGAALATWLIVTATFYVYSSSRFTAWQFSAANPPMLIDFAIGQTGFLVSGIFILGLAFIDATPIIAGAILGCLIIKPQVALLLPFAMIAGRRWRVIAGAILSSAILLTGALLAFGTTAYVGFWNILPYYLGLLHNSKWPWNELASPFALARFVGLAETPALWIHSILAITATFITIRAWWLNLENKIPILAAATLLIPPYILTYDALLLIVPAAWLIRQRRFAMVVIIWICSFLPLLTYATPLIWPNLISVAAALCLGLLTPLPLFRRRQVRLLSA
jgi:hypothetical protein